MADANPFTPGQGATPPTLAGRGNEQEQVNDALQGMVPGAEGMQHVILYGPRGMGKTVLLRWLAGRCAEEGVAVRQIFPSSELLEPSDAMEMLDKAVAKRRDNPLVLLMDEAHTVEDLKIWQVLLNATQYISMRSPLMLALAGTPGLMRDLQESGASFVERCTQVGVGALKPKEGIKAACEVGQAFLRNEGRPLETLDIVSVIDATLKESIRDAQVREDTAWSLHDRLNDMDYFWDPPDGPPEPGIPSIMNYIGVLHGKEPVPLSVDMDALDLGR